MLQDDPWFHDAIVANLELAAEYWAKGDHVQAQDICQITWPMLPEGEDFIDHEQGHERGAG